MYTSLLVLVARKLVTEGAHRLFTYVRLTSYLERKRGGRACDMKVFELGEEYLPTTHHGANL
jgi:hypothetical protein